MGGSGKGKKKKGAGKSTKNHNNNSKNGKKKKNNNKSHSIHVGRVVHSLGLGELEILERAAIVVDSEGVISSVKRGSKAELKEFLRIMGAKCRIHDYGEKFIVPGLIDTHAHAPQYAQLGLGTDLPLLDWLNKYTFPTESKFGDAEFARRVYSDVVRRFLANGTTSCVYFASLHLEASKILCDVVHAKGQHAFVGKVNMDRNSPDFYRESAEASLEATRRFVEYARSKNSALLTPIITPRFVISCTHSLMQGLGELAARHSLPIQSHISENKAEIAFTKELHPEDEHYADVYEKRGLLTPRTIMAHAVHLTDAEIETFRRTGACISHCPVSNFTLLSGVAPVRKFLEAGIKVGLGTDISGGYAPSVWEAMRSAIVASVNASFTNEKLKALTYAEAFHLGTLGGSELLGMSAQLGNFEPGKWFNAQVLSPKPTIDTYQDSVEDVFQKLFYLLDDRNIKRVYVKGRRVK